MNPIRTLSAAGTRPGLEADAAAWAPIPISAAAAAEALPVVPRNSRREKDFMMDSSLVRVDTPLLYTLNMRRLPRKKSLLASLKMVPI